MLALGSMARLRWMGLDGRLEFDSSTANVF
jgi:hypothetical protein